jgi:type I restriction enzyme, S subunit
LLVVSEYVLLFLKSPTFIETGIPKMTGTAGQKRVSSEYFAYSAFPLPPLAEQKRIVAKVDELMALCDQLAAAQVERETLRQRLTAPSLARLNQPAEPSKFREHVQFHLQHFPRFTVRPSQIPKLRQTILNLAVRGKLVPQDPNDEPARKHPIVEETLTQDRIEMSLPRGWTWAKVSEVAESRLGKMLDKAKNSGSPYAYLRNTNVHWFDIRLDDLKTMLIEDKEKDEYLLRTGDVLICEGGHGIGRTAVWRETEKPIVFQKALHRVRCGTSLDPHFFSRCVAVYFAEGILEKYYTGVGIPHFTGVALSKLVFPLPPLAEQKRIVAKVDELMALCDALESQLTAHESQSRQLLDAELHEALAE